jgi:hypothetical protein
MTGLAQMVTAKIALQKKLFADLYALNLPQEEEDRMVAHMEDFVDTLYMLVNDGSKTLEQALAEPFFIKNQSL